MKVDDFLKSVIESFKENAIKIVNLTPHEVSFVLSTRTLSIPSSGEARLSTKIVQIGSINGIPIRVTEFGDITGLPDPEDGVIYIVSSMVAQKCKDRIDVFYPNEPVRNEKGQVIGCKSLGRIE